MLFLFCVWDALNATFDVQLEMELLSIYPSKEVWVQSTSHVGMSFEEMTIPFTVFYPKQNISPSSILSLDPSTIILFPFKPRVIWVPGISTLLSLVV